MKIACIVFGVATAAVAVWRLGGSWAVLPFLAMAGIGAWLAFIDLRQKRLPNAIVLPAIAASIPALLAVALADQRFDRWIGSLIGGTVLFVLYLVLALISPSGMGMGDVKLAALVGMYSGYLGWTGWFVAALAAFLVGGVVALAGILARRADRRSQIPFGPWMLVGLFIAVAVVPAVP